jgi:hypothetical protein
LLQLPTLPSDKTRLQFPVHYDYLNPSNPELRDTRFDVDDFERQFQERQSQLRDNQRAVAYFKEFMGAIRSSKYLIYHEHLFRLLEKEGNLEIAMKTSHLILKELSKDPLIRIDIKPMFQISPYNKNIAVWDTKLQNLNS